MLKKILLLMLFVGTATHCPAQQIHTNYTFSQEELNTAGLLVETLIKDGYSPEEIPAIIAQSTSQEDTIQLVAPSKISKNAIIYFAIGAGVGLAAMTLIYGSLYTGAYFKDKNEATQALKLQKEKTDRLEKENKELEEKKNLEAIKEAELREEEDKQKLAQGELDRLAKKEHQKPLIDKLQDTNTVSEINKELKKKNAAEIEDLQKKLEKARQDEQEALSKLEKAKKSTKRNKKKKIGKLSTNKDSKTKQREALEAKLKNLTNAS